MPQNTLRFSKDNNHIVLSENWIRDAYYKTKYWISSYVTGAAGEGSGDQEGDGVVVSADGNVIAVKTHNNNAITGSWGGQVYLLVKGESGFPNTGAQTYSLGAPLVQFIPAFSSYGRTMAISGNGSQLFVSAYQGEANPTTIQAGIIYEFVRSGNTWLLANSIIEDVPFTSAELGHEIDCSEDGNVMVAINRGAGGGSTNYIYTFLKVSGSWSMIQRLATTSAGYLGQRDDYSMSLSRDGLGLVTGNTTRDETNMLNGAVKYYNRSLVSDPFVLQQLITYSEPFTMIFGFSAYYFGDNVAISDDKKTMVITVIGANNLSGVTYKNDVVILKNINGTWTQTQRIIDPDTNNNTSNSFSNLDVDISGDGKKLLLGRGVYNFSSGNNAGRMELWKFSEGEYRLSKTFDNNQANPESDYFGEFVNMSKDGRVIVGGAPRSSTGAVNGGETHIFELTDLSMSTVRLSKPNNHIVLQ